MGINGTSGTLRKTGRHPLFGQGTADATLEENGCYAVDIMITLVCLAKLPSIASALHGPVRRSPQLEISQYMDGLMDKCQVKAKNIKLVLVFDGQRYPYKQGTHEERTKLREDAAKACTAAKTHTDLLPQLIKGSHYDGTVVSCVITWLHKRPDLREHVKLFGAPFEAEAQCVHLEKQGIVDGILSTDSDILFHGGVNFFSGYNRIYGGVKYCSRQKHAVLGKLTAEEMGALAAFLGCDYYKGVNGIGWKKGQAQLKLWQNACKDNNEDEFFTEFARKHAGKFEGNFKDEFRLCQQHFKNYPIWLLSFPPHVKVEDYRGDFWNGKYSATLGPASESADVDLVTVLPKLAVLDLSIFGAIEDMREYISMKRWARGEVLKDVPYPTNTKGEELPYGAYIDWNRWKINQVSPRDLRTYLKFHNIFVNVHCPITKREFQKLNAVGQRLFGMCLHDRVQQLVNSTTPQDAVTLKVAQQTPGGCLPWTWNQGKNYVTIQHDTIKCLGIISNVKVLSDEQIADFTPPETTKQRAFELLRGGNMFVEKIRLLEAFMPADDGQKNELIMFQMPMQASQNALTYNVLVAFDKKTGNCMPSPFSHCSCPAGTHCCSHFLGSLLVIKHLQLFYHDLKQVEHDPECKWQDDIQHFIHVTDTKSSPNSFMRGPVLGWKRKAKALSSSQVLPPITPSPRKKATKNSSKNNITPQRKKKSPMFEYHRPITNERTKSKMMANEQNPILASIVKYFPPQLRNVTGMSIPLHLLFTAAERQDALDKKVRDKKKHSKGQKANGIAKTKTKGHVQLLLMHQVPTEHSKYWNILIKSCSRNNRWRDTPSHVLDPRAIMKSQDDLAAEFPRDVHKQYQADLELTRAWNKLGKSIPLHTLIGHYLVHNWKHILKRLQDYEQTFPHRKNKVIEPEYTNCLQLENDRYFELCSEKKGTNKHVPDAKKSCKQAIADRVASLEGTWECQPTGDVDKEIIFLKKAEEGKLYGVYEKRPDEDQQFVFAIHVKANETKLVPNLSRRKRKRQISVLHTSSSPDQLVWETVANVRITWKRLNTPEQTVTRGQMQRRLNTVRKLTNSREKIQRMGSRRKCCCSLKNCNAVAKFSHKCQKLVPRMRPSVTELGGMKLVRRELRRQWIQYFRLAVGLPIQEVSGDNKYVKKFVNHHHWPEKFWRKYIDQGQFPKWIPMTEAKELGMYVDNHRLSRSLRFENTLPDQHGEYVFCVPWLKNNGGRNVQQTCQADPKVEVCDPIRSVCPPIRSPSVSLGSDADFSAAIIAERELKNNGGSNVQQTCQADPKVEVCDPTRSVCPPIRSPSVSSGSDADFSAAIIAEREKEILEDLKQRAKTPLDIKVVENLQRKLNLLELDPDIAARIPTGEKHGFTSKIFLSQTKQTCKQFFGYNSREEMLAWMAVHWPDLKEEPIQKSSGKHRQLTEFEEACMTRMFMRTNINISMLASLWWTNRTRCSRAIAKWVPRWEYHSKIFCRLIVDKEFLMKCQVEGMAGRYGVPISHLVDGTVIQTDHARKSNALRSSMYSHKISACGTLALAHTTPNGLGIMCTDNFGAGAQEVDLVRIYERWWAQYPAGFGRLVDKGFAWYTNIYYKNRSKAVFPGFLTKDSIRFSASGTKQLTPHEVKSGRRQSRERYMIETYFSRVKSFKTIHGPVHWGHIPYINAIYLVGCATANTMRPLRFPVSWKTLKKDFNYAKRLKR